MIKVPSQPPKSERFPLPETAIASHPGVILSPRDLRNWVAELPLANPPKAARLMLQQLRLQVRDPQPGARFSSLLEMYEQPIGELLLIVHQRLDNNPDSAMPLDQLEFQLVELLYELARGQLRSANQAIDSGKGAALGTLFRAISLLDTALNIERLHYCRLDPQAWRLLLQVFVYAERQQLSDQPVAATMREHGEPDTIRGVFYRCLVICLIDPHLFQPGEVLNWYRWCAGQTGLLDLSLLPKGISAIPFDISGELPPLAGARRGRPGREMRYLVADRLLQQLQDDPNAPQGLYSALQQLINGRKSPEQRQSLRQERDHPYRLVYGLHNIHQRLSELTQATRRPEFDTVPIEARQVNQSKYGAAFHLDGPLRTPLSIGEPLLAESTAPNANGVTVGFSGCIRRVVHGDSQVIEIGVEKLRARIIPVTIGGSAGERARGASYALLQHATERGSYTLLAARTVYRKGDILTVESADSRLQLRMLGVQGAVRHIVCIEVEKVD